MIQIEKAEAGRWYRTPRGFRIRLIGPDEKTPGAFAVETESGRRFNMEAGSELRADEDAPAAPADNGLLGKIADAVKVKDHAALGAALGELPDGELDTVLSRHPTLWVVGAVNAEKRRRAGASDPSTAFDDAPREADRPITCPTCGEQAAARLNRGGKWVVVTHAGPDAPVCPGAGHVVTVATGETPEPATTAADRIVQVRDLDTLDALHAFQADLEARNLLTKTVANDLAQQGRFLETGAEVVERAKAGSEEAIRSLATWGWIGAHALDVRPGVRRAFDTDATWAEGEVRRIADEREASIARDVAGTLRAEAVTGPDPERVDRALDAEEPDPALRARVDALRSGVRGCRDAARIELDPAVVERAISEEQAGEARPTILGILEARLAKLRGETRRNVKAREEAPGEPQEDEGDAGGTETPPERQDATVAPAAPAVEASPPTVVPALQATIDTMPQDEAVALVMQAESLEALQLLTEAETEGPRAPCRIEVTNAIGKRRREIVNALLPNLAPVPVEAPQAAPPEPTPAPTPAAPADPLFGLPEGTRLGLVPLPDGTEDVFAELPGGEKRRLGTSTDPGLRPVAVQIRKAALQAEIDKARRAPQPPIEAVPASPLQALFADLAAALAPMKAAGIRVSITIDTDGGAS